MLGCELGIVEMSPASSEHTTFCLFTTEHMDLGTAAPRTISSCLTPEVHDRERTTENVAACKQPDLCALLGTKVSITLTIHAHCLASISATRPTCERMSSTCTTTV